MKLYIQGSSGGPVPGPDVGAGADSAANRPTRRFASAWTAATLAATAFVAGCDKGTDKVTCPQPATSVVRLADISASAGTAQHRQAIEKEFDEAVAQAAFCRDVEAHLAVFSSSAGDSRVLYTGAPEAEGPNDRARNHKLKVAVVPGIKREVHAVLAKATAAMGPGSDPLAGFDLLRDYAVTHPGRSIDAKILSDGVSTSNRLQLDHPLTSEDMAKAATVPVATVTVSKLLMTGVGATAPPTPPADYVAALRTFWTTVCQRVAAGCVVTSEVAK